MLGKKIAAAVSGAMLLAYLLLHMLGNLTALAGAGAAGARHGADDGARIDGYAEWLRTFGEPLLPREAVLWGVRAVLLLALVVHVTAVVQLARRNRAARPRGHGAKRIGRSWAARSMIVTGPLLLLFIVFHVLQFTTLTIDVTPLAHGAVYANLHDAFAKWYFLVLYLTALGLVGFHLRHGIWSLLQTLGLDSRTRNRMLRRGATGVTLLIVVGFALIPVLFFTGGLPDPQPAAPHGAHGAEVSR